MGLLNILKELVSSQAASHINPKAEVAHWQQRVAALPVAAHPSVTARNQAGQPTQLVYTNMNWPAVPTPPQELRPLGQIHPTAAATSLRMAPPQPDLQGFQNPGMTPLQTGGYANQIMHQRPYNQQGIQVGPTYHNMHYLINQ